MSCAVQNKQQGVNNNIQFDYPDVRVPYLCTLLAAGHGNELYDVLQQGTRINFLGEDQLYCNQNYCRAQKYFGSMLMDIDFDDPDFIANKLPTLTKQVLTQRY